MRCFGGCDPAKRRRRVKQKGRKDMFGYVIANPERLSETDRQLYQGVYCGICHSLGEEHGLRGRITLNYDMVFLALVLSSVYTLNFERSWCTCPAHPLKKQILFTNEITRYAAEMNIALAMKSARDNWIDDKNLIGWCTWRLLQKEYQKIYAKHPRQCDAIEAGLAALSDIEREGNPNPDAAAAAFGRILSELFIWQEDKMSAKLRMFGGALGRVIYMMDAAVDLRSDLKRQRYNPLSFLPDADRRSILEAMMHQCALSYRELELDFFREILDNIIYSGIWTKFEMSVHREEKHRGRRSVQGSGHISGSR